jgi:hypothetical protein
LVALVGLVALGLTRSRVDLTSVLFVYGLALWLTPSRYAIGPLMVTAMMAVGFLAALLWVCGRVLPASGIARDPSPTNRAVLLFVVVALVGYVIAVSRPITGPDLRGADRNLLVVVGLCGIAVAVTDGMRTTRQLERFLGAIVGGASIVGVIAFVQYFAAFDAARHLHLSGFRLTGSSAFTDKVAGFRRVAGTARNPVELGIAFAATLPLALHFASFARTLAGRRAARLSALLIVGAIPLAFSRFAFLAVLLVGGLLLPTFTPSRRWAVVATVALTLLVLPVLVPGVFERMGKLVQTGDGSRGDATEIALNLIGDRPVLGHGFGETNLSPVTIDNQYLVTGVETGLVGLGALIALTATGIATARRARRSTDDPALQALAQSLVVVIGVVALAGFGLNVLQYPITAGLLFVGIGGSGALLRITSRAERARGDESGRVALFGAER